MCQDWIIDYTCGLSGGIKKVCILVNIIMFHNDLFASFKIEMG